MKVRTVLLLISLLSVVRMYPSEVADDEADIKDFRERHTLDTAVLFFVNQESQEQSGFWASIFNLFGSSSESDESFLVEIAENNPLIKIDVGKDALAHSTEDYGVESVPLVIAFHHDKEILRERPTTDTADKLDDMIRDIEAKSLAEIDHASTVHPERNASSTDIWDNKTDTDEHHHPKPLVITPDFGHLDVNDPSESALITTKPIESLDEQTGAKLIKKSVSLQSNTTSSTTTTDDMLIDYKRANQPKVEDPTASAWTPGTPRMRPTDGRRDVPLARPVSTRSTPTTHTTAGTHSTPTAHRTSTGSGVTRTSSTATSSTRPTHAPYRTSSSASARTPSASTRATIGGGSSSPSRVSTTTGTHTTQSAGSVHSKLSNDVVHSIQSRR